MFGRSKDIVEERGFNDFRASCNPSSSEFNDVFKNVLDKVKDNHTPDLKMLLTLMINIRLVEDDKLRSRLYEYLVEELVFYISNKEFD